MASMAFAAPILPGKMEVWQQFVSECRGPRHADYVASIERRGIALERVFHQHTPDGYFAVVYWEGDDMDANMGVLSASNDPFDVWFKDNIKDIHGIDVTTPPPGPLSELQIEARPWPCRP